MLCKYVQSSLHANSSTSDSVQLPNSISLKSEGFLPFQGSKNLFQTISKHFLPYFLSSSVRTWIEPTWKAAFIAVSLSPIAPDDGLYAS